MMPLTVDLGRLLGDRLAFGQIDRVHVEARVADVLVLDACRLDGRDRRRHVAVMFSGDLPAEDVFFKAAD